MDMSTPEELIGCNELSTGQDADVAGQRVAIQLPAKPILRLSIYKLEFSQQHAVRVSA